jgi:hypothetical protein
MEFNFLSSNRKSTKNSKANIVGQTHRISNESRNVNEIKIGYKMYAKNTEKLMGAFT